ncbi:uncharacterized protein LOC141864545 isoform X7 [Acropora palmata]|uniref:uncharacterized protein LOC141864545 isoform X7 n=1 Tax=Acropora palmata TaxID=6131 RepID=UPI003DA02A32
MLLKEGIRPSQLIVRSYKEREELAAQFCEADLAIMPSRSEGFGLAALEALSAGLPVLVSGNSGVGDALKELPFGASCIVNSEDTSEWAKAICAIHDKKRKLRLWEAVKIRESYAEKYHWQVECGRLVERMLNIIQETSTSPDQADAAVNLGEQGPSSVSESVSYPGATIQHIVGDAVSSGRENVIQEERPRTHPLPTTKGRRGLNAGIPEIFNDNSVVVKLLKAEYNRRAQFNPLLWDDAVKLPLENVYTRLKIVSRWKPDSETRSQSAVFWLEDSWLDKIGAGAWANEVNPCDIFGVLKKGDDPMILIEGSPGIGKTTFCLKLAYDWANQSSSAASFPEFELVLLLKCRDIDGDLTEAITEQLLPNDISEDIRKTFFHFLKDIHNQERILIILDGLDELPEKSRHHVDLFLRRRILSFCYVLTTTRQEKGIEARKQFAFDISLKIEGFTEEDSFEYIRRHFKNVGPGQSSKGEKLIEEIKENQLLRDLQKNPLHLLLLCVVYQDHEGKLPSSRTDLYQVIVVCLLRRYCARHNVKASKEDMDLEKQFKRDIRCLGELAWNCLLSDRHSFFEEELEELERKSEKLVARRLGFVYKEESLKVLKPQHEYCFLHKSFQEYLAASYIAHKLQRNKFNIFEHLNFDAVVKKFLQVFLFLCGILRKDASILFEQIGEKLKSDWDWYECSEAAANFFMESWSESGNAEGMANTLCLFLPFPRVVHLLFYDDFECEGWNLLRVLFFCRRFSKLAAPDEIHLEITFSDILFHASITVRDLASLPNLKSLDISECDVDFESAHKLFQILPDFASLTKLALPEVPEMTDWGIAAKVLTTSKTLEKVECILLGDRGEGWFRAFDAGLCADTAISSIDLTIRGPMRETALQALENLLLNKSLSSLSLTVDGDMSYSLAVTLSRALAGQTALKVLELRVNGKLSFCCANLIERGIVNNNSLCNLVVSLRGELPVNWQAIAENLNIRLTEKSTVTFQIHPNTFSQVTASQFWGFRVCGKMYGFFEQKSVTLNVWGELTVDGAKAIYSFLSFPRVCHLTLNIHGKLTDDFLHCTARHVDKQKPLCPITINTWNQLTKEGKALFKELELDKNRAVTLNVCDVHVPSDESGDNKIVSIDNAESLIELLEGEENTGKENIAATINVRRRDPSCDDSEDFLGRSWLLDLPRNCSLNSLTLTMNNFTPSSAQLSFTLISFLESCIALKSLNLTLNEYNDWEDTYASLLYEGLGSNTSLIFVTLTLNIYTRASNDSYFDFDGISDDDFVPNISMDSFTLTINDFIRRDLFGDDIIDSDWGLKLGGLWPSYKSLNTFNLTLNNRDDVSVTSFLEFFDAVMKVNSLRTLRLKMKGSGFRDYYPKYDFSELAVKSPSLELIELTLCHYRDACSWLETLKWEKQR